MSNVWTFNHSIRVPSTCQHGRRNTHYSPIFSSFQSWWVLEKTLESPWDSKEIQPVHPKGNKCWIVIGRTDAEAETPRLWPPDGKNWLIGKDPDAGKDWRREEKGTTEGEMVGWHHWPNGRGVISDWCWRGRQFSYPAWTPVGMINSPVSQARRTMSCPRWDGWREETKKQGRVSGD